MGAIWLWGGSAQAEMLPFWNWGAPQLTQSVKKAVAAPDLDGEPGLKLDVQLGRGRTSRGADWMGEALWLLPSDLTLRATDWNTRYRVSLEIRIGAGLVNTFRSHRARLFLVDEAGKRQYLPNQYVGTRPEATRGWILLSGRPATGMPIPLGFTDEGFRADRVRSVGVNFEAGGRPGESLRDWVEMRRLQVEEVGTEQVRRLPVDPAVISTEKERAEKVRVRWRELFGAEPGRGRSIYGVNLAWPSTRSPDGQLLQLYGSFLEAVEPWYGRYWDLARNDDVAASLRSDFQSIRQTFGQQAIVRIFLFADLHSGIEMDEQGIPRRFTPVALASLDRLFALAREEQVVLLPTIFDFLMADGKANPVDARHPFWGGEAPHLMTDPTARTAMVRLIGELAARYRNEPALLAWDVMNEPENATAVVTPEHLVDLQIFLRDAVDAIQAQGVLATVGHRNPFDARDFFRGVVRTSLGQTHYYPNLETRPAPFGLDLPMREVFGDLPGGWGELPARAGGISDDFGSMRRGGADYVLFWSWRGDDENADGFEVRSRAAEIRSAIHEHGYIPYVFTMDDLPMWFVTDPAERLRAYARYRDELSARMIRGVFFINGAGLDESARPGDEWAFMEELREWGHFLGNHGAHHKPLSEVSWDVFWADTLAGVASLDAAAPGWRAATHYYRFPNSEWGQSPEESCRELKRAFGVRILPVTADLQDYRYAERYHFAQGESERGSVVREALSHLDTQARRIRERRMRASREPGQAEYLIVHSTRFMFDNIMTVLEELEKRGARWVAPDFADATQITPEPGACVPACRGRGECR